MACMLVLQCTRGRPFVQVLVPKFDLRVAKTTKTRCGCFDVAAAAVMGLLALAAVL